MGSRPSSSVEILEREQQPQDGAAMDEALHAGGQRTGAAYLKVDAVASDEEDDGHVAVSNQPFAEQAERLAQYKKQKTAMERVPLAPPIERN